MSYHVISKDALGVIEYFAFGPPTAPEAALEYVRGLYAKANHYGVAFEVVSPAVDWERDLSCKLYRYRPSTAA